MATKGKKNENTNWAGGGLLLKPCPICGKSVHLSYSLSWGEKYPVIQCMKCHLRIGLNGVLGGIEEKETMMKIVEIWAHIAGEYEGNDNIDIILKEGMNNIKEAKYINA